MAKDIDANHIGLHTLSSTLIYKYITFYVRYHCIYNYSYNRSVVTIEN